MPQAQCPVFGCRRMTAKGLRFHPLPHASVFTLQLKAVVLSPKSRICSLCFKRHTRHVTGLKGRVRIVPRLTARSVDIGVVAAPFVSHPAVLNVLYTSLSFYPGLSHWSLHPAHFPLTVPGELQPPYYSTLDSTSATNYFMPVVPFNLPKDRGDVKHGALRAHYKQPRDARVLADVLRLVGEHSKRSDELTLIVYQKDNETFSA